MNVKLKRSNKKYRDIQTHGQRGTDTERDVKKKKMHWMVGYLKSNYSAPVD